MIAIDLSKQQKLDADPRAIQQIALGSIDRDGNTTMFFITEKQKKSFLNFYEECKSFVSTILLNTISSNTKYILIFINIKMTQYN